MSEPLDKPTVDQSAAYQAMFNYFNRALFGGTLPPVMLTMSRNSNLIGGYYCPSRWFDEDKNAIGEIAINANVMKKEGILKAMGILVHEMVHLWQNEYGKPSRPGYHNTEWAQKAKVVGLQPYGKNGEEVGQTIDTKIIPGGACEKAMEDFPEEELFPWMSEPMESPDGGGGGGSGSSGAEPPSPKKAGARTKYTCPTCGWNLWGKGGGSFLCMACNQAFIEMKGGQSE